MKEKKRGQSVRGCKGDWASFVGPPKEKASARLLHRSNLL